MPKQLVDLNRRFDAAARSEPRQLPLDLVQVSCFGCQIRRQFGDAVGLQAQRCDLDRGAALDFIRALRTLRYTRVVHAELRDLEPPGFTLIVSAEGSTILDELHGRPLAGKDVWVVATGSLRAFAELPASDMETLVAMLRRLRVGVGHERRKLIAADAGHHVFGAERGLEHFGDPAQKRIPGIVPKVIIGRFEAVEVANDDAGREMPTALGAIRGTRLPRTRLPKWPVRSACISNTTSGHLTTIDTNPCCRECCRNSDRVWQSPT